MQNRDRARQASKNSTNALRTTPSIRSSLSNYHFSCGNKLLQVAVRRLTHTNWGVAL